MTEETQEMTKEKFITSLMEALSKFPNAPTHEQIEEWKKNSDVMASGLDDDEIYLWRPINRREFKAKKQEFMLAAQQAQQEGKAPPADGSMEEALVDACILWASSPQALQRKAGSYEVLYEQIMASSNFINPAVAAQMVLKL
jgi:hypothetical protein